MNVYVKGVFGILLGFLTIGMGAGLLASASYLISLSALMPNIGVLTLPIVAVRFFGIGRAVCRYGERYLTHAATFAILSRIRTDLYNALEPLAPMAFGHARQDLARTLVFDADILQEWYLRVLTPSVVAALTYGIGAAVLASISPSLALVYTAGALLVCVMMPHLSRARARVLLTEKEAAEEKLSASLDELVHGLTDARSSGAEARFAEAERCHIEAVRRCEERLFVRQATEDGMSETIAHLTVAGVLFFGVCAVTDGLLGGIWLAAVTLGVSACMEAFLPMTGALRFAFTVQRAKSHLRSVTDTPPPVRGEEKASFENEVRFDNVSYTAGGRLIVDGVSLSVKRGQKVAIVGASGSGKTTLTRLLLGYHHPTSGTVTFDGVATTSLRAGEAEKLIAPIPQRIDVFGVAVADNIRLAEPTASEDALMRAYRGAEMEEADGSLSLDRSLAAGGHELSGGERQRIAIARYLLTEGRDLAVWDEPLTGLSADMAERIGKRLMDSLDGRALLLVTHRLSHLDDFDEILVMDNGRIIERGSEKDLLALGGRYAEMKRTQLDWIDADDEVGYVERA